MLAEEHAVASCDIAEASNDIARREISAYSDSAACGGISEQSGAACCDTLKCSSGADCDTLDGIIVLNASVRRGLLIQYRSSTVPRLWLYNGGLKIKRQSVVPWS